MLPPPRSDIPSPSEQDRLWPAFIAGRRRQPLRPFTWTTTEGEFLVGYRLPVSIAVCSGNTHEATIAVAAPLASDEYVMETAWKLAELALFHRVRGQLTIEGNLV